MGGAVTKQRLARAVRKEQMAKYVVLWISHKQAIIVSITDGVEEVLHVESKAKGGVEEKWRQHRAEHYRKVILLIQDAKEIFIFGPAQAKMEMKIEILKSEPLSHRVVGTETADTMTENELVPLARVICRSRIV
jgi:stalled ribosome rescue protein Dom34